MCVFFQPSSLAQTPLWTSQQTSTKCKYNTQNREYMNIEIIHLFLSAHRDVRGYSQTDSSALGGCESWNDATAAFLCLNVEFWAGGADLQEKRRTVAPPPLSTPLSVSLSPPALHHHHNSPPPLPHRRPGRVHEWLLLRRRISRSPRRSPVDAARLARTWRRRRRLRRRRQTADPSGGSGPRVTRLTSPRRGSLCTWRQVGSDADDPRFMSGCISGRCRGGAGDVCVCGGVCGAGGAVANRFSLWEKWLHRLGTIPTHQYDFGLPLCVSDGIHGAQLRRTVTHAPGTISLIAWLFFQLSMWYAIRLDMAKPDCPYRTTDYHCSNQTAPRLSVAVTCCGNLAASGYSFTMQLLLSRLEKGEELMLWHARCVCVCVCLRENSRDKLLFPLLPWSRRSAVMEPASWASWCWFTSDLHSFFSLLHV